jgi:hypothetical protein
MHSRIGAYSILARFEKSFYVELKHLISSYNNHPVTMSEEQQSQWPCPYCFRPFPTAGELRSHLEADRVQPIYLFRDHALTFGSCKKSLLKFKRCDEQAGLIGDVDKSQAQKCGPPPSAQI